MFSYNSVTFYSTFQEPFDKAVDGKLLLGSLNFRNPSCNVHQPKTDPVDRRPIRSAVMR